MDYITSIEGLAVSTSGTSVVTGVKLNNGGKGFTADRETIT